MEETTRTDAEVRELAVQMYRDGRKLAEIEETTGRSRSTIYYFLDQAGVKPRRQGKAVTADVVALTDEVARLQRMCSTLTSYVHAHATLLETIVAAEPTSAEAMIKIMQPQIESLSRLSRQLDKEMELPLNQ